MPYALGSIGIETAEFSPDMKMAFLCFELSLLFQADKMRAVQLSLPLLFEAPPVPAVPVKTLLARIPERFATLQNFSAISEALEKPRLRKALLHLPQLNFVITYLLRNRLLWPCITGSLLNELSKSHEESLYPFIEQMWGYSDLVLKGLLDAKPLPAMSTVAKRLARLPCRPARASLALPPPPIPASSGIEPITTSTGLIVEGRVQHNCIGTLAVQRDVIFGYAYCYRLLSPVRATIHIRNDHAGNWIIEQIKLAKNADVSAETRIRVEAWLATASLPKVA